MASAMQLGTRVSTPASTSGMIQRFQGLRVSSPVQTSRPVQLCSRSRAQGATIVARTGVSGVGMLGTKAGMTQIFTKDGLAHGATVIALEEGNIVTQVKSEDTDGYSSVQVGYLVCKESKITCPELGHLKKANAPPMRRLKEFRLKSEVAAQYQPGQELKLDELFKEGDLVDISGTTVGKGFQGSIKRWNMRRGLMSHGSKSHRQHGSIGASATPSRVLPGLKMAGQMGNKRHTNRKLEVLMVDPERRALVVKGNVPGKPGGVVEITPAKIVGVNV